MSKILTLTKVMLKNTTTGLESGKKRQKKWQKYLSLFGGFVLIAILAIVVYFMSFELLLSLQEAGLETLAIQLLIVASSAYLFVVSVITVPLVFYFSKDVEHLLSLPLKPFEILSAKAITTYVNLLVSTSFIIIPFGIAYQLIIQPNLSFSIFYLIAYLIIPILPLALVTMLIVLLFTFFPKVNNKDLFTYFTSIVMFLFIFIININPGVSGDQTEQILLGNIGLINQVSKIIPTIGLLIHAVSYTDILSLIAALVISLVLAYASLRLVDNFYFKGVLGAQGTSSKKKKRKKYKTKSKNDSQMITIMKVDIKNILRTPSLAINYLLPIVMLPLFMFVPLLFSFNSSDIEMFKFALFTAQDFIKTINGLKIVPFLIFISFIVTYFLSAFTSITSTSISREGENMKMYKSMPIKLITVVNAKILLGMIVSGIFPLIISVIVSIALKLNIIAVIIIFISIIIALAFSNTSDILLDLIKPKLEWDDEIQAVKQNFVAVIPIFASFGVIALFAFIFVQFNVLFSSLLIISLSAIITIINYKVIIPKYAIKKLDQVIQDL